MQLTLKFILILWKLINFKQPINSSTMKNLATFVLLISAALLYGNHNRAGEILYKRIAPFTNVVGGITVEVYNYSITVVKYSDYGPAIADRCVDTVYFGDGAKGVALRVDGLITNCCAPIGTLQIPCGDLIINQPGYKVLKSIYSIIHTYPGPGGYTIRSQDPNRNSGVINIPNSGNVLFYIESHLDISSFSSLNSSPESSNIPTQLASITSCFYYNSGATDADGDSLSYSLNPCNATGFTFPAGSFSINNATGLLSWCNIPAAGEYDFGISIKEWRKNTTGVWQQIGYVNREMQVIVVLWQLNALENQIPDNNGIQVYPNPVNNTMEIRLPSGENGNTEIELYSADGRIMQTRQASAEKLNIDTENLASGVYFIKARSNNTTFFKKIIKE
jgi:hypothetical protein